MGGTQMAVQDTQVEPPQGPGMARQRSTEDAAVISRREAATHSPRVLLLCSAALVMVFVRDSNTSASVAALLVAAVATGCALLYPSAV
jgi:hypothetical protein